MRTRAAVLCGGEGKRLKPLTDYFQKTMIPVGAKRRPLLEYVIRLLVWHRVKEITLLTGYMSEQIENYFGDGSRFGAAINYSRDVGPGMGSAGALARAVSSGKLGKPDNLLVYYGDVLSNLNIGELLRVHESRSASVTLVLSRRYTLPVGVAQVKDGIVREFREKPTLDFNVTTGCMVIGSKALTLLKEVSKGHRDLMSHFVPTVIGKMDRVAAYTQNGFWYDVGTTEAYDRLDNRMLETHLKFLG